ncbi:MAG: hypothetical protein OEZ39_12085 [Gammaproteobacteria bacterium]|nr:hypothetical protein [Gammaproteobacteria bacterium]MDH5652583.1 hypothetical protein [Gammaproteobacteria bacterium]
MAYTDTNKYKLYYRDRLIGEVSDIHFGLGWLTGRFDLSASGQELIPFLEKYLELQDLWGGNQEVYDQAVKDIALIYGFDMVDVQCWRLANVSANVVRQLAVVPFVDLELDTISWREEEPTEGAGQ